MLIQRVLVVRLAVLVVRPSITKRYETTRAVWEHYVDHRMRSPPLAAACARPFPMRESVSYAPPRVHFYICDFGY